MSDWGRETVSKLRAQTDSQAQEAAALAEISENPHLPLATAMLGLPQ
jgi:hypothetical protein